MRRLFERLVGKHTCECGAVYKVMTMKALFPDTAQVNCEVCGRKMDSWYNSGSFRCYDLISRRKN